MSRRGALFPVLLWSSAITSCFVFHFLPLFVSPPLLASVPVCIPESVLFHLFSAPHLVCSLVCFLFCDYFWICSCLLPLLDLGSFISILVLLVLLIIIIIIVILLLFAGEKQDLNTNQQFEIIFECALFSFCFLEILRTCGRVRCHCSSKSMFQLFECNIFIIHAIPTCVHNSCHPQ